MTTATIFEGMAKPMPLAVAALGEDRRVYAREAAVHTDQSAARVAGG